MQIPAHDHDSIKVMSRKIATIMNATVMKGPPITAAPVPPANEGIGFTIIRTASKSVMHLGLIINFDLFWLRSEISFNAREIIFTLNLHENFTRLCAANAAVEPCHGGASVPNMLLGISHCPEITLFD